jgi:hypothetical protein
MLSDGAGNQVSGIHRFFDDQAKMDATMATAGLSLVAFMNQQEAIAHLLAHCTPADPTRPALIVEWQAARARKGAPMAAGNPDIQDITAANRPYLQSLMQLQWAKNFLAMMPGAEFKLVEIDPLLTIHFMVDLERSGKRCAGLPQNPSIADLMPVCLPTQISDEPISIVRLPDRQAQQMAIGALLLTARTLNVRITDAGYSQADNKVAIQFGTSIPIVQVVRYNGRCYLHDGLHRTLGARLRGATHVPCLFRDAPSASAIGLKTDRSTFSLSILESADAPTVGHFAQGRAYEVQLKPYKRVIHVSWAEYTVPDE